MRFIKSFVVILLLSLVAFGGVAQTVRIDSAKTNDMTTREYSQYMKKLRRDSIRANKAVWLSILGGPSYTPEASLGVGGAILASFRMNRNDSISQRSYIPAGFNVSINGTFIVAGAGVLFFNENRFKIYANYGYRNEPANFYGVGFDEIDRNGDLLKDKLIDKDQTIYRRSYLTLTPRFIWSLGKNMYAGGIVAVNYNKVVKTDSNSILQQHLSDLDDDIFRKKYHNMGLGAVFQYDTRNDVATPTSGLFASASALAYGKYFGGKYNYELFELEYRQFQNVFRERSTLAWIAKTQIGVGDVPFTELPTFGSPNDLRGFLVGKYRDKSMAFGIVEYRHMFGTQEQYDMGKLLSKFGFVAWVGTGTIGKDPADWDKWKLNYGVGLRIQIQPGKNFRLDIGGGPGQKLGFYMNMTEAF